MRLDTPEISTTLHPFQMIQNIQLFNYILHNGLLTDSYIIFTSLLVFGKNHLSKYSLFSDTADLSQPQIAMETIVFNGC